MLRTNLASRPFYETRAIQIGLGILAAIAVVATVVNGWVLSAHARRDARAQAVISQAEHSARTARQEAARLRDGMPTAAVDATRAAVAEANGAIGRRTFSWTTLFNLLETTLPEDVRILAIRPRSEPDGHLALLLAVEARRIVSLDTFIDRLEASGQCSDVIVAEEATDDAGLVQATLIGQYRAPGGNTAFTPPHHEASR